MDDLPHDPTAGHTGFERELPDNSVEYLLFIIDHDKTHSRNILQQLEELRKAALNLFSELTRDYIWQRDEFNIELKNQGGECLRRWAALFSNYYAYRSRPGIPPRYHRIR